jgi:protein TonB
MTPAEEQDPRIPQAAKLQDERFLPRLDARAFWTAEHHLGRSQITSFVIHGGLAGLVILLPLFYQQLMPVPSAPRIADYFPISSSIGAYVPPVKSVVQSSPAPDVSKGGGSGGGGDKLTVTKGTPRFSPTQILPPHLPSNFNAALTLPSTIIGDAALNSIMPKYPNLGDPSAAEFNNSNGSGKGNGMGDKDGVGIGNYGGPGPGYGPGGKGGFGGEDFNGQAGIAVSDPVCVFCPRPEYSDEARKAKYQGQVLLSVVVLANGQAGKIQVVNGPGLGLDQKAIEAVRNWRFKPAIGRDGKPVATVVTIQVMFQLF